MRIAFLISGRRAPSTRFRVLQYLPHLRAMGVACDLYASRPEKYRRAAGLGWRGSALVRRAAWWAQLALARGRSRIGRRIDVVFVEREVLAEESLWFERRFRELAPRLVLDVDDAIHLQRPRKMAALSQLADQVIAGNSYLADAFRAAATREPIVLPTCIDAARYRPRVEHASAARPVIGWIGTPSNLPYFAPVLGALRALAAERDYELRIVTERRAARESLDWRGIPVAWRAWSEPTEIDELRQFDVGLMPLIDDPWTRGKCGLKAIQYLAVGVPAVVSPVGANREVVLDGQCGYWADDPHEWLDRLRRLAGDAKLRSRLGAAGRGHVERNYSVAAHLETWIEAVRGPAPPRD